MRATFFYLRCVLHLSWGVKRKELVKVKSLTDKHRHDYTAIVLFGYQHEFLLYKLFIFQRFQDLSFVWIFHNTHVKLKLTFNCPKNSTWAFENRRIFVFHQKHLDINSRSSWSWIQQEYPECCLHGSAAKFYEPKSLWVLQFLK
jgi:hypothetical protein